MASIRNIKTLGSIKPRRIFDSKPSTPPPMKINKKLDFDSCSEEDVPRSSSPDHHNNDLRKKLLFDFMDDDELELSDAPSSPFKTQVSKLINSGLSPIESRLSINNNKNTCSGLVELHDLNTSHETSMTSSDKFSPCRTRSGKIYTSVEKNKLTSKKPISRPSSAMKTPSAVLSTASAPKSNVQASSSASKLPTPVFIDARENSRHASGASGIVSPHSNRIQTSHLLVQEVQLGLLQQNIDISMDEADDPPGPNEPPPLNYSKRPVSRLLHINVGEEEDNIPVATPRMFDDDANPWLFQTPANPHSPPTNEVKAMRLFDKSPMDPRSSPRRFNCSFGARNLILHGAEDGSRRISAPANLRTVTFGNADISGHEGQNYSGLLSKERKRKRVANINPFTPTSMLASLKKKYKSEPEMSNLCNSFIPTNDSHCELSGNEEEAELGINPAKRLRVSDINIRRYEEEFVEIKEIASGSFGKVKIARHCLDGMVYAIKVTRNKIHGNTHEERVAMTEVFAHSSLMKHKHVVRYYNSWVENGHVYIQNEYCEGGSLANLIKEYRKMGRRLPESELKRILLHVAKGLQYIHSKQLVHLDLKPENIFISLDHLTPSPLDPNQDGAAASVVCTGNAAAACIEGSTSAKAPVECGDIGSGNESTDSGHASGCDARFAALNNRGAAGAMASGGVDERISYKIGDLGHVSPIFGDTIPEEGDCRYMAPELLTDDIDRTKLPKADIFSLGLTLYEAASLQELPRNSLESQMYERIKNGDLPFIEGYSKEFNALLKSMVHQDQNLRPSASKIVSHPFLRSNSASKTRSQLYKELRETKAKLRQLELELLAKQQQGSIPNLAAASAPPQNWLSEAFSALPLTPKGSHSLHHDSSSPASSPIASASPSHSKFAAKLLNKSKQRLVGRGTQKSYSCLL